MKKFISIILVSLILLCIILPVSASGEGQTSYTIGNKTIIFEEDSELTPEQKEYIANLLVNPESGVKQANLICNIFGHKNTTEVVASITHCVVSTDPRCLKETFEITVCSRCNESSTTKLGQSYIFCCPED